MKTFLMSPRLLLVSLVLLHLAISTTESASMKSRNRKKLAKEKEQKDINVCDIEQLDTPLYCHCNEALLAHAESANCIIFKNLDLGDPIWAHFNSQMYLRKLTFVVRSDGTITYVPTAVLQQLKSLNFVSFQHAKLEAIESQAFAQMGSLSAIHLSQNNITALKWHAFEGLRNLTDLNLDDNSITELSRDIFYDVPRLQKLFLNHNNISLLHEKAFAHLPSLQELELNNNRLKDLSPRSFKDLNLLQRLDLRNNLIEMLGERVFIEMPQLQELDLDQNRIKFISNKALDGLGNLRKLRLSENKLITLEPDFLVGAPSINLLDLRDNALRTLTFDNIKPVITNFYRDSSFFYIDGNKLICDCKLHWIWGLKNETMNSKLKESLKELKCLLEASYDTKFDAGEDINRALEIVRNEGYGHMKPQVNMDESQYLGDNYDDYNDDYGNLPVGHQTEIDGKRVYVRNLFDLKPEQLPCPAPSREDVMASEQPSNRREHSSSFFSFAVGSAGSLHYQQSLRLGALVLLVPVGLALLT